VILLVVGSLGASASAQQPANTFLGFKARISSAEFEAASIRKSDSKLSVAVAVPQVQPGGRFIATNVTLVNLIMRAYDVREFQLGGVTDSMRRERYDIVATAGGTAHEADVWMMVRNLLAQRFRLSLRIERRDVPGQALVFARNDKTVGPNLMRLTPGVDCKTAMANPTLHIPPKIVPPNSTPGTAPRFQSVPCGPMSVVAAGLESYFLAPVIDQTGLEGEWVGRLYWTNDRNATAPLDPNIPTLGTALREQWGLKTQETRAPLEVITIESVQPLIEN
jgi:uncharacterized protein (TIGR03435 family)